MAIPSPEPGLVISYAYLWRKEFEAGQEEGRKNRPCVIVLSVEKYDSGTHVTVAPITHSPPSPGTPCLEIPLRVKQHLGLDDDRSWVILDEVNQFVWPGYDLRPVPGKPGEMTYGFLPPRLFDQIRSGILDIILKRRGNITPRD
ncbi:MAG: type II toxin-antitoxin system PemK/MazF family toxin [Rickettsiales bacterium]|nr:type II toxin-antitoxin system PemK/MazF family toxin [Rickettsiales bacterium]